MTGPILSNRDPHTNIGDSEHPGGMQSYCSASGRDNDSQGLLPDDFWSESEYRWARGSKGGKYAQRESSWYIAIAGN